MLNSKGSYNFRGLELKLIWFDDHDCTEGFGVINKAGMSDWVVESNILKEGNYVLNQDTEISNTTGGGHLTSAAENFDYFS